MIDYTWSISTCEHEVSTGGITVAHWDVVATEGDYTSRAYGTVSFEPNVDQPDFKPYEEVSEQDVLNWVWGTVDKEVCEKQLLEQINLQKNPVIASGTPW